MKLTIIEILIRLLAATLIAGVIGFDRELKNHPAGIRTHILVCVGACIIALIQDEIGYQALMLAKAQPQFAGVIRADDARLIAQVVSGIGFLGAGTILVTRQAVTGLTTAASLWTTAGLGIAVGMGYYQIAVLGALVVLLVLVFLKKIIKIRTNKRVEIKYEHRVETASFIRTYFEEKKITVENISFKTEQTADGRIYTSVFSIETPPKEVYLQIIEDLSLNDHILQVRFTNL